MSVPHTTRTEYDLLGTMEIPADTLWGIHTQRAIANFPITGRPVKSGLIQAFGMVKLAAARTNHSLGKLDATLFGAIEAACEQMITGELNNHVVVDALQGGAGTSTNMNVNEVIANVALKSLGKEPGDYEAIHPIDHVNLHQSTNDTYSTALKIAAIKKLHVLEQAVIALMEACQEKEKATAHVVKIGRTQLQDAVLTTLGRSMSAFADAFARDRWRIYKCEERLRVINLGGTAIGTGLGAPRQYIFKATESLKDISGIGLARAENLVEATQNNDECVEVSGILKALASNLIKVANDLRLLASGPMAGLCEISLAPKQAGSSIMPDKVNPVIPEAVIQAAIKVISNDAALTTAVSMGNLELNAFMPLIADSLLDSLDLLTAAAGLLAGCIADFTVNEEVCSTQVANSTAVLTSLIGTLGYETVESISSKAKLANQGIKEYILKNSILSEAEFNELITPEAVMRLGSR